MIFNVIQTHLGRLSTIFWISLELTFFVDYTLTTAFPNRWHQYRLVIYLGSKSRFNRKLNIYNALFSCTLTWFNVLQTEYIIQPLILIRIDKICKVVFVKCCTCFIIKGGKINSRGQFYCDLNQGPLLLYHSQTTVWCMVPHSVCFVLSVTPFSLWLCLHSCVCM